MPTRVAHNHCDHTSPSLSGLFPTVGTGQLQISSLVLLPPLGTWEQEPKSFLSSKLVTYPAQLHVAQEQLDGFAVRHIVRNI